MSGLGLFFRRGGLKSGAALSDADMAQYARSCAARLNVNGYARLFSRAVRKIASGAISRRVERLTRMDGQLTPAMEWLSENIRWVEGVAQRVKVNHDELLPAQGNAARLMILMRELTVHTDRCITGQRLIETIAAFDEVQGLTMSELWMVPRAMSMAVLELFFTVSGQILADQHERIEAKRWVEAGATMDQIKPDIGSAFCERALKLLNDHDMNKQRQQLTEFITRRDGHCDSVIRRAHERRAVNELLVASLIESLRDIQSLRWDECFERVSVAERCLKKDDIYARMDLPSRGIITRQVTYLAKRARLSEWTIANQALTLSRGGEGSRATLCHYLYDDDGRRALMKSLGADNVRIAPIVPDPSGHMLMMGIALGTLVLFGFLMRRPERMLLFVPLLIMSFRFASDIVGALITRWLVPRPLLLLKMDRVSPDCRTLVALPVLLSSKDRADALIEQLETLGTLCTDDNIEFVLLGDFKDSAQPSETADNEILRAAREGVNRLNERSGSARYHYLHRNRVFSVADGRYMGYERKRGALMALNDVLLGLDNAFDAEGHSVSTLTHRFRYVITLDADSRILPTAIGQMIGAIAHPLNRARVEEGKQKGYALLTPRVEMSVRTAFARLLGGMGGVDSYCAAVGNLFRDLCGRGLFCGKGIYDVHIFHERLAGKIPDNTVLSHDLLEGIFADCGFLESVAAHDGFPETLSGYIKRLHRWTRGDWQLIPFLFGKTVKLLDRFLMLSNLMRSLTGASAFACMLVGLWAGDTGLTATALLLMVLPFVLSLPNPGPESVRRAIANLALLPLTAWTQVDAVVRALYRSYVSHRSMLEWMPASDADGQGDGHMQTAGRIAALLVLPACLRAGTFLVALGLGMLFFIGAAWMISLTRDGSKNALSNDDVEKLKDIAERTWHFFETFVPVESTGLPPDNVQLDPPLGMAKRTSPTNIGLYVLSCLCAFELRLIDFQSFRARMEQTISTLESLPKWKGQLYNWYDIETLSPLPVRYVSAVDSGNLAACLMLCACALPEDIAVRLEQLVRGMDFSALYDDEKELFFIGYDAEHEKMSESHYDLLASEAHILSFVAIALGQIPVRHWFQLGRARTGHALISWSGTLFEYLMPGLFLRAPEGTLLHGSNREAVRLQRVTNPEGWGISESGFYAFDLQLNYQYRAFGLKRLSLRGGTFEQVIAPYASMLALPIDARAVMKNITNMQRRGWMGEYGWYEAVDFDPARLPDGAQYKVIPSHMTHHQGMILASVAGALTHDRLVKYFQGRPEIRALSLLLEEKPGAYVPVVRRVRAFEPSSNIRVGHTARIGRTGTVYPDGHLLYAAGRTYFVDAKGHGFFKKGEVMANRTRDGLFAGEHDGLFVHVMDNEQCIPCSRARFDEGEAVFTGQNEFLQISVTHVLAPGDGTLIQHVNVKNISDQAREIAVLGCFEVALCKDRDMRAHPAYQNLFVKSECKAPGVLCFSRHTSNLKPFHMLTYAIDAPGNARIAFETDRVKLTNRDGRLWAAQSIEKDLTGTIGFTLDPCAALKASFAIGARETKAVTIATAIQSPEQAASELMLDADFVARARTLSGTQMRAMRDFLSVDLDTYHLLQRASIFLFHPFAKPHMQSALTLSRSHLWAVGISGDHALISVFVSQKEHMTLARDAVQAHAFYCSMGVQCDMVFVNDYGNDYMQPVRDELGRLIDTRHAQDLNGRTGTVRLLEGQSLSPCQRETIKKFSALCFEGGRGRLCTQLRRMVNVAKPAYTRRLPMRCDYALNKTMRELDNGYGGFADQFTRYRIDLLPGRPTPRAWSNVLSNPNFGALVTERGGGFLWAGNSRLRRITPCSGDSVSEGFPLAITLSEPATSRMASLIPVVAAAQTIHEPGCTRYHSGAEKIAWDITQFVDCEYAVFATQIVLSNHASYKRNLQLRAAIQFLMGAQYEDARLTQVLVRDGLTIARGEAQGAAYLSLEGATVDVDAQALDFVLEPNESRTVCVLIGHAENEQDCAAEARAFTNDVQTRLTYTLSHWEKRLDRIELITPECSVNAMVNTFLPYQTMTSRIQGRTGLSQSGGAIGFRDQLQDMLAMLFIDPGMVRTHILDCAKHQFESGDVMHWWHPPMTGVRTKISDDLLFLPYVTAKYVHHTGDERILEEVIPYLAEVEIPEGESDLYAPMQESDSVGTLCEHCMRAFYRSAKTGNHGLPLMGGGDWNDGMNRVGNEHAGESIWLGLFLSVTARAFAKQCAVDADKDWLISLSEQMKRNVETFGWDGRWYRRAYYADGEPMGSINQPDHEGCHIDLIAQGWAVEAGLDDDRIHMAMDEAWDQLVDCERGLIKLLTPPFGGEGNNPGYISAYPPGVRENGGQYTHGACWGVMGWAGLNQADRAWQAFSMLMPSRHTSNPEAVSTYRAEPYVVAGDVYGEGKYMGRAGWTWYTGAAAWLQYIAYTQLMGIEKAGDRIMMNALLPDCWDEASVRLKIGQSNYWLIAKKSAERTTLDGQSIDGDFIPFIDDGRDHRAVFPVRRAITASNT